MRRYRSTCPSVVTCSDIRKGLGLGWRSYRMRPALCFGVPTQPRPIILAYKASHSAEQMNERRHRPRRAVASGFRPGRVPISVELARRLGNFGYVQPLNLHRVDGPWVHGRDQNTDLDQLASAKVALLGCGSLGSGIAMLLAKSGVGHLDLVDPEVLVSANASRHEFGANHIGQNKAECTARRIAKGWPNIRAINAFPRDWQHLVRRSENVLRNADLIVCTIGSWRDEGRLEAWRTSQENSPKAVFGWLEPYAAAGHIVTPEEECSCLGCGLEHFGQDKLFVTNWDGMTTRRFEPACSTEFQSYGATGLAQLQGLIAETALDVITGRNVPGRRIWCASRSQVNRFGGQGSTAWRELPQFQRRGCTYCLDLEWAKNSGCAVCGIQ